jgi:iron-sulfur cluster insertion protein
MINLTDTAIDQIRTILSEETDADMRLRVFVTGGGCSGMQYGFTLDSDISDDDFQLEFSGIPVLVNSMSSQYLQGARIDYREDIYGASFSIDNPNASTTCGCGSSFSPQ